MQILQRSTLDTDTQMPRTRSELQQLWKERTLRENMQTKIQ